MTGRLSPIVVAALAAVLAQTGCETESGGSGGGVTTTSQAGTGGGSTTTTTTTDSETTTTTTTTAAPLECTEPVSTPKLPGKCDLVKQDCPPGGTCWLNPDGKSTLCLKGGGGLKGAGKSRTPDPSVVECEAGYQCVGPPEGGICTRPCCVGAEQVCGGGKCDLTYNLPGVKVRMCTYGEQCTLFGPKTCKAGQKCTLVYPDQGLAVCAFDSGNNPMDGEACSSVNDCVENAVCYLGFCHWNCYLDGSGGKEPGTGACPGGQMCNKVYSDASANIGVCQ